MTDPSTTPPGRTTRTSSARARPATSGMVVQGAAEAEGGVEGAVREEGHLHVARAVKGLDGECGQAPARLRQHDVRQAHQDEPAAPIRKPEREPPRTAAGVQLAPPAGTHRSMNLRMTWSWTRPSGRSNRAHSRSPWAL